MDSLATLPNALTEIHLQHLGGAVGRVPADATAFALRDQEFIVNIVARTPTAEGFADASNGREAWRPLSVRTPPPP